MGRKAISALRQLEQLKTSYGGNAAALKVELLRMLDEGWLSRSREVFRLHEVLCFLRAYPDNPQVLASVEGMLARFDRRKDLRLHSRTLASSGIAGTVIRFPFFWFTAEWLARRWPDRISVDWTDFDKRRELEDTLRMLVHASEQPALDELTFPPREWMRRLKRVDETDACFLIRRFEALPMNPFGREAYYESFNIPIRLTPGPDTPSRTKARYPAGPVAFQARPLSRTRPRLRDVILHTPIAVRSLPPAEGRKLIDLAREAMVTRSRDLDVFENASAEDVRLVDCGQGLQFACIGVVPERRLLLEAVYGFLTLKNGVPIGYVLATGLFKSSEAAFNMFETYRGAESAFIFSRALAMVRHLFGSDAFTVDPFQLGYANTEGLRSGAWWFYYKLGFRPYDAGVRKVLRAELERMRRTPGHRSTIATINRLASENVFLHLGRPREDVLGKISLGDIGLAVARNLADRFGADRERGARVCSREAARLLGVRVLRGFSRGERLAWERWGPLIVSLDGVDRWSAAEKRALVRVVRAKGGRRESEFVHLFNRHHGLQKALLRLAERG